MGRPVAVVLACWLAACPALPAAPERPAEVERLAEVLRKGKDAAERRKAAEQLAKLGAKARAAVPALASDKKHWWSGAPDREAEPFHWTGRLDEGGTLEVHGINGNIHATLASGDRVEVEAVRRGHKDDPEDVKIEVIERGEKVIVCARYPNPSGGLNDCGSEHQNVQDCDVTVEFTIRVPADFKGTPEQPLDRAELREKFLTLTRHCGADDMGRMFDRLQNLEDERDLDWIGVGRH